MKELYINNKDIQVNEVFIENQNNLLIENQHTFFNFFQSFLLINDEKNVVKIGNKKLDSRNSHFINLLDFESIYNQIQIKKGTLIFEYIINEIAEKLNESITIINEFLENIFEPISKDSVIEYQALFDIDIAKLFSNFGTINHAYNINKYKDIIWYLVELYIQKNPKKTIIIFLNKYLFPNENLNNENTIFFNINNNNNFNLFVTKDVVNFDEHIIKNYIILNWPVHLSEIECDKLIQKYINYYYSKNQNNIDNIEMYIMAQLFNNIMGLNNSYYFIGNINKEDEIYQKYLKRWNN